MLVPKEARIWVLPPQHPLLTGTAHRVTQHQTLHSYLQVLANASTIPARLNPSFTDLLIQVSTALGRAMSHNWVSYPLFLHRWFNGPALPHGDSLTHHTG